MSAEKKRINYYPFGLKHKGYNNVINGRNHKYGFGGKEEQDELGLNTLDFGARNYQADLGRWMNVDPLAEARGQIHNSPYAYAMNNPIYFTDPDGNCPPGVDCVGVAKGVYNALKVEVVGAYNFVTKDAWKSSTWKGLGNLALGVVANSGRDGSSNLTLLDDTFGTNTQGAINGLNTSVANLGEDLISGDAERTSGALTAIGLAFLPSKLDDVAKLSKIDNVIPDSKVTTDFVVTPKGNAIPIPDGAVGPVNPQRGTGMSYQGGSGGKGMNSRTTGTRIMDANSNQGSRVNYMNKMGQTVDPSTGRTISNKDPRGHTPIHIDPK